MRYLKLTKAQRRMKHWRERRNHLVCELLAKNPRMLSHEALRQANRMMKQNDRIERKPKESRLPARESWWVVEEGVRCRIKKLGTKKWKDYVLRQTITVLRRHRLRGLHLFEVAGYELSVQAQSARKASKEEIENREHPNPEGRTDIPEAKPWPSEPPF